MKSSLHSLSLAASQSGSKRPYLALSAILVGRQSLDSAQAQRLYAALVADDPGFPTAAKALRMRSSADAAV